MSGSDRACRPEGGRPATAAGGIAETATGGGAHRARTPPGAPAAREEPDLRLLRLVGPMWLGQAVVLLSGAAAGWGPVGAGLIVAGLLGGSLAAGVPGLRRQRGAGTRPAQASTAGPVPGGSDVAGVAGARPVAGSSRWISAAPVVALVACGLGLGVVVGALHVSRLRAEPLTDLVARSAVMGATVRITGDPRMHQPASDGGRQLPASWSVPARLEAMEVRGRTFAVRVPVLLRGDQVQALRYGALVDLLGRAQPTWAPAEHALVLRVLGQPHERAPPGPVARATTTVREAFRQACAGLPADAGALLLGLSVGDESTLPASLDDAMLRSGLSHLTAVSGSNTSLVAGLALGLAAALGLGWRSRIMMAALVLAGYVALVRPQPSVLRAAAMGAVALVTLGVGGRRRGAPALLAAVLVLLVVLPQFAIALGFALSVAATAGLLLVGPALAERMGHWPATRWAPEAVRAALAVATAAHLATLPLALLMGNGASLVALPANVLVTPFVPLATTVGLVAALSAPVAPAVAQVLAHLAAPATGAIAWIARTCAAVPGGVLAVPEGPGTALLATAGLAAMALVAARGWRPWRHRRLRVVLAVAVVMALALRGVRDSRWPPPDWLVLACDVGQGSGLLVRAPEASDALLVDVGPRPEPIVDCLRDAGVRRVVVLLSHFHADHVDGLSGVVGHWPVTGILATPVTEPGEGVALVLGTAAAAGVPVRAVRAGDRLEVAGLRVRVLWPARRIEASPANNGSVVALVEVPGPAPLRLLLTGDVEPEAQAALMAGSNPGADVVTVPHHGSPHQVPGFATWTGAAIALVSVGRGNDYGHPSAATLAQYATTGAAVGRTDEQGSLAVTSSGNRAWLWVQR